MNMYIRMLIEIIAQAQFGSVCADARNSSACAFLHNIAETSGKLELTRAFQRFNLNF